ncbi:MAG: hypothetical protein OXF29_01135 [Hyphomicrobiales bacterium]|nr:hypothetical protein [Hyphomicrobiales bacterium]
METGKPPQHGRNFSNHPEFRGKRAGIPESEGSQACTGTIPRLARGRVKTRRKQQAICSGNNIPAAAERGMVPGFGGIRAQVDAAETGVLGSERGLFCRACKTNFLKDEK